MSARLIGGQDRFRGRKIQFEAVLRPRYHVNALIP